MFLFRRFRRRTQPTPADAMTHGETAELGIQGDGTTSPAGDAEEREAGAVHQSAKTRSNNITASLKAHDARAPHQPHEDGNGGSMRDAADLNAIAVDNRAPDDGTPDSDPTDSADARTKTACEPASADTSALCPVTLSPEEVAFLFGGAEAATQRSPEYRDFLLRLHGMLRSAIPSSLRGYMLLAFSLGILPVLGNQMQRATFPLWFNVLLWLTGIFASAWLLHKGNGECVKRLARDIHAHRVPSFDTLRGCVHAVAACAIAMPSPALTLFGCVLLLPPVSRSLAITLLNRVREADLGDGEAEGEAQNDGTATGEDEPVEGSMSAPDEEAGGHGQGTLGQRDRSQRDRSQHDRTEGASPPPHPEASDKASVPVP